MSISYAVFCLKNPATTAIYTLSLHDALPIYDSEVGAAIATLNRGLASISGNKPARITSEGRLKYDFETQGGAVSRHWVNIEALSFARARSRSEEHTSELQSHVNLVCRLLLEKSRDHRDLHSFPTRRSSDLRQRGRRGDCHAESRAREHLRQQTGADHERRPAQVRLRNSGRRREPALGQHRGAELRTRAKQIGRAHV